MKGISAKMVTDEETVRMHTNFAEFKNVTVGMGYHDNATWSKEDGVLKIHTNTVQGWGVFVHCNIPKSLLKAGQKYGVSIRSNVKLVGVNIQTGDSTHKSKEIVKPHWDGEKISAVVMLEEADVVDDLGVHSFLYASNTDYEIRDFRIWEIDDLGGGNS